MSTIVKFGLSLTAGLTAATVAAKYYTWRNGREDVTSETTDDTIVDTAAS